MALDSCRFSSHITGINSCRWSANIWITLEKNEDCVKKLIMSGKIPISRASASTTVDLLKAAYINSMWSRISNDRKDVFVVQYIA